MLPIYFGAGSPKRTAKIPWFVRAAFSRGFWTTVAIGALLACLTTICFGGATIIPSDHICSLLNKGESCSWTVVRSMKFKITALYNETTNQSAWVLTRGNDVISSAPLPTEIGPITEDDLLNELKIVSHMHYMTGDDDVQQHILNLARTEGVAYVSDVYALKFGNGTNDGLATVFSGKVKINIAQ